MDTPPALMTTVLRLTSATESLAALGAHLRARREGLAVDPAVGPRLAAVAAALGVPDTVTAGEEAAALGAIRAFFRQAHDLLEDPARPCGWTYDDPVVLDAQGRASISIADAIAGASARLEGLAGALGAEGGAFLDVGCGVGWLSIAMARRFAGLRAVGLDVWPPALALADANVSAAGLGGRVTIRREDVCALDEEAVYDAAWVPGPFLPRGVCLAAVERVHRALRPGGWILLGLYGGPREPVAEALAELRAVRSGGHPWTVDEAAELLRGNGFVDVGRVDHGIAAPVTLVAGRRAP